MPNFKVFKGVIYASDLKPSHYIIYESFIMKTTAVFSYRSLLSRDRGLIRVGLYIKFINK